MKALRYAACSFLALIGLQACLPQMTQIITEYDVVNGTSRIKKQINYYKPLEKGTSLYSAKQIFLKETNGSTESYTMFDVLKTMPEATRLKNNVFVIIDEKEPIQIKLNNYEIDNQVIIDKKEDSILKADSTTLSVITDYDQKNLKNHKISYNLDNGTIQKIKNANIVDFRYYLDADMITLRPGPRDLRYIKTIIDTKK
jgi:hypothetical protein